MSKKVKDLNASVSIASDPVMYHAPSFTENKTNAIIVIIF